MTTFNWNPNTLPPTTQSIAFTNTTSFNNVNLQTSRTINDVTFGEMQGYTRFGGSLLPLDQLTGCAVNTERDTVTFSPDARDDLAE